VLATATVLGGRYVLGTALGRGGVADVYRADDLELDEPVAVKVLRNATTADFRRFELEARTLERLDHPSIVRLRAEGEHDGVPYLVLDLVDGEPLSCLIERGALPEDEMQRMGAVLAGALAHAHEVGIVHRDVKPGNVLVDRDRSVHLTDFGIARLVDGAAVTSITETGLVVGTAAYLAPEQVRGEAATRASDIYSLGLVLLEAVTGARAYDGPPAEAAVARLQRPPRVPPLAPWLTSLLTSMTALEPRRRPRAAAVADAFANRTANGEHTAVMPIPAPPPSVSRAPVPANRRGRLLAALAAVVIALALILYLVGSNARTGEPPATSDTSTTVPTTASVPAAPATTPSTASPATQPQRHEGKGKGKDAGDNEGSGGG
jgi:serine/threonine protein kinase